MNRILSLAAPSAALLCLLAGPAFGSTGQLCGGRVEVTAISPQWHDHAPGQAAIGLRVSVTNLSGEAILFQPVLSMGGRPQQGQPMMLVRRGERTFALQLPLDQQAGLPAETLIRALGASCRLS